MGLIVLVNLVMLHSLLLTDQGLLGHRRLKSEHGRLAGEVRGLEGRSVELSREIRWLEKGGPHMEKIIREKANLLKEDEIVYLTPDEAAKGSEKP